jgi:hypothetical protein
MCISNFNLHFPVDDNIHMTTICIKYSSHVECEDSIIRTRTGTGSEADIHVAVLWVIMHGGQGREVDIDNGGSGFCTGWTWDRK